MSYHFSIRWRFESGHVPAQLDAPIADALHAQFHALEFNVQKPMQSADSRFLCLRGRGYETFETASIAGRQACASLALASMRFGYGVLLAAQSRAVSPSASAGSTALTADECDTLFDDEYGLGVYADSDEVDDTVRTEPHPLVPQVDRRFVVAYDFLAISRKEASVRARFLVLVMAIETLIKPALRSPDELALVETLTALVKGAPKLNPRQRRALSEKIVRLKEESFETTSHNYLVDAQCAGILTDPVAADYYGVCHFMRGRMLQKGFVPPTSLLVEHSHVLEAMLRELLTAMLEQRWS